MTETKRIPASALYIQSTSITKWRLEDMLGHNRVRYFSYGRYALLEALKAIGLKKGNKILLPEFICRDLLAPINAAGAVPLYYPLNRNLNMGVEEDQLPQAQAIVAVNYFGFPQYLLPFSNYCNRTGAILIEDNAHGLFSRDEDGRLLGTRGEIGIFSMRKTIDMPNGAALVINSIDNNLILNPQLALDDAIEPLSFRAKRVLKSTIPWAGATVVKGAISLVRFLRRIRTGQGIPQSSPDAEWLLPGVPEPCRGLFKYISQVDIEKEVLRRRYLYQEVDNIVKDTLAEPVFSYLPNGVVPYVYPFIAETNEIDAINNYLLRYRLEAFPWPDLPDIAKRSSKDYYMKIWGVQFLW